MTDVCFHRTQCIILYIILYFFSVSKKKEIEKDKENHCIVIHRLTGNHIMSLLKILKLLQKVVLAKIISH